MRRSARDWASACASVLATTNSTPSSLESIMLFTALPPAPPTPRTVIRGRNSVSSGALRLIAIFMLLGRSCSSPCHPRDSQLIRVVIVESLEQPTGQPGEPSLAFDFPSLERELGVQCFGRKRRARHQQTDRRRVVGTK